jgi:hypothetical protein
MTLCLWVFCEDKSRVDSYRLPVRPSVRLFIYFVPNNTGRILAEYKVEIHTHRSPAIICFKPQCRLYLPHFLTIKMSVFCSHNILMCSALLSK